MGNDRSSRTAPRLKPLGWWAIFLILLVVIAAAFVSIIWFLEIIKQVPVANQPQAKIDATRAAALIVGGVGGFMALFLTLRRQRSTEISLLDASLDAATRRTNEIFSKSLEQLTHESAPVRLGAVYLLEILAQENPKLRQPVIDVVCGYLRIPFTPPGVAIGFHEKEGRRQALDIGSGGNETKAWEELQVRDSLQHLIERHLRVGTLWSKDLSKVKKPVTFWPGISLDLRRASLLSFDLDGCIVEEVDFSDAIFYETTTFRKVIFQQSSYFNDALFKRDAWFSDSEFKGLSGYRGARFSHHADFSGCIFHRPAMFHDNKFAGSLDFERAKFRSEPAISHCQIIGSSDFSETQFDRRDDDNVFFGVLAGEEGFQGTVFLGDEVTFSPEFNLDLTGASVSSQSSVKLPEGWRLDDEDSDGNRQIARIIE